MGYFKTIMTDATLELCTAGGVYPCAGCEGHEDQIFGGAIAPNDGLCVTNSCTDINNWIQSAASSNRGTTIPGIDRRLSTEDVIALRNTATPAEAIAGCVVGAVPPPQIDDEEREREAREQERRLREMAAAAQIQKRKQARIAAAHKAEQDRIDRERRAQMQAELLQRRRQEMMRRGRSYRVVTFPGDENNPDNHFYNYYDLVSHFNANVPGSTSPVQVMPPNFSEPLDFVHDDRQGWHMPDSELRIRGVPRKKIKAASTTENEVDKYYREIISMAERWRQPNSIQKSIVRTLNQDEAWEEMSRYLKQENPLSKKFRSERRQNETIDSATKWKQTLMSYKNERIGVRLIAYYLLNACAPVIGTGGSQRNRVMTPDRKSCVYTDRQLGANIAAACHRILNEYEAVTRKTKSRRRRSKSKSRRRKSKSKSRRRKSKSKSRRRKSKSKSRRRSKSRSSRRKSKSKSRRRKSKSRSSRRKSKSKSRRRRSKSRSSRRKSKSRRRKSKSKSRRRKSKSKSRRKKSKTKSRRRKKSKTKSRKRKNKL